MFRKPPNSEETRKILRDLRGKTLIVEGMKDEKALKTLGLNNIIKINRKPLYQVAQEVSRAKTKEVVILTDFDRDGRALAAKLMRLFRPYKIRVNKRLRRKIMEFGKPEIENLSLFQEKGLRRLASKKVSDSLHQSVQAVKLKTRQTERAQAKRSWSSKLGPTSKFKEFREDDLDVKVSTNFNKIRCKGKDKSKGRSGKT